MRDRLIKLTGLLNICVDDNIEFGDGFVGYGINYANIADYLIANGVTVQEWISVKDRLPEDVYGKDREQIVVLVCTKSGKVSQCARMADYECIADKTLTKVEWIKNGKFYWSKNKAVTHWMPLPEPPKGE